MYLISLISRAWIFSPCTFRPVTARRYAIRPPHSTHSNGSLRRNCRTRKASAVCCIATDNLDTSEPLIVLDFIFCRLHLIGRTMPTLTVIKHFDVIKNIAAGFFPRSVDLFLYALSFQQLEKAFCNRIIMAVTATAHAALQAV